MLSKKSWTLGARIGDPSGFGKVYEATADEGETAVAKLVPKEPGADRELLFEELSGVPNVVPIIDTGETKDEWVLVMPRAERSLRGEIDDRGGTVTLDEALPILIDITKALAELANRDEKVVHRDLKPENVLYLNGHWCLADFGIARYAEASTAPDTKKLAMSPPYAPPERWRFQRATPASDIYSLGIMAQEMLTGHLPFTGPGWTEFHEQHVRDKPPALTGVPAPVASLVDECLYKAPEARPTPTNLLARLERANTPSSPAAARLQEVQQQIVSEQSKNMASASAASTEKVRRDGLFAAADQGLVAISAPLREAVLANAGAATPDPRSTADDWALRLGEASLGMDRAKRASMGNFGPWTPKFDVIAFASVGINIPPGRDGYHGRIHSLWYGDIQEEGVYRWFETGFMVAALIPRRLSHFPAPMEPCEEAGKALSNAITEWQVARKFRPIDQGEETAFIERWLDYLAQGGRGHLADAEQPARGVCRRLVAPLASPTRSACP